MLMNVNELLAEFELELFTCVSSKLLRKCENPK